ncbi:ATP-binding protein [uncultured Ilyobacter sp.]|uniref:ATP-binding protein n=1 Tax=uncultured Ilyobacter sp. TaxID=544433 RepID=UPI0029C6FFA4|nr:ATP-binding protein [uncultured Ilyobacter sp.]
MKKNELRSLSIIAIIFIALIVSRISYLSYVKYQDTIMTQQIEHLMTISKSIGRSLNLYIGEKGKGLKNLAADIAHHMETSPEGPNQEYILRAMKKFHINQNEEVSNLNYMEVKNRFFLTYPKQDFIVTGGDFYDEISYVKARKKSYIGYPYHDRNDTLSINIVEPVIVENELSGIIFGKIKLENMNELLLKPVKIGEYGYAVVKDSTGKILMHPSHAQVGDYIITSRKKKYPHLDYKGISSLFKKQLTQKEGFHIYYSYWWPQDTLELTKKINVFSRINFSSDFWIVSVVTSYDEINKPIRDYLYSSILISTIIILISSCIVFWIVKIIKNKEAYEMETNYLRELNKSTEELRKKDAELHHRRKLETIGTLTGGIAHEFNNILTPIMGHSEILLRNLDPDLDNYEDAEAIYNSSKRAQEIIDHIRVFSGDKNIKIKYNILPVNKVVEDALKFSEFMLPSNIKIEKEIKEDCGNIYANETQIHQVILNLCTNACNAMKNTKDGMLKIKMDIVKYQNQKGSEENADFKREYIRISFEDNGCGIEEDIMEKIFDPFFTKKLSDKSSGLGLSIVQGIVTKHGGMIEISSKINTGSKFEVYIPKAKLNETIDSAQTQSSDISGKEKVLIIDDDKGIADMLKRGLNELGYSVSCIVQCDEILKKFTYIKENFDIVVTDLTMPEISGIQIAKKIKRNQPNVKIILITAYSDEPLEEYMKDKTLDDYLIKPVSAAQVSRSIRKIMEDNQL